MANTTYNYSDRPLHQPDPSNPVLFIIRKIPKKAIMFSGGHNSKIKRLSTSIYSSIISGMNGKKWFKEKEKEKILTCE